MRLRPPWTARRAARAGRTAVITPTELLAAWADRRLDAAVFSQWRSPFLPEVADDGAIGLNARWQRGESPEWRIEVQRPGADLVVAGALRGDGDLTARGWQILDWGLRHQAETGAFPSSAGLPRHTTAFYVEALARALLADPGAASPDRLGALRAAATWLAGVRSSADEAAADELVHRWWLVAAALAESSAALAAPKLLRAADRAAARGTSGTAADGVLSELGGHDARYQAMGVLFAARYLLAHREPPAGAVAAASAAASWLLRRVDRHGDLDMTGSTRTGNEDTPNGIRKGLDLPRTLEAMVTADHAIDGLDAARAIAAFAPLAAVAVAAQATEPELAERPRRFSIAFVCQGGALEPQALLLAASLREHVSPRHELLACVPGPPEVWAPPVAETLAALEALEVRIAPVTNPLGADFPHANKIGCLAVPTDADVRIFLDTDVICLGPLRDSPDLVTTVAAKTADLQAYTDEADVWAATYAVAGQALPAWSTVTSVSRASGPPFFNTGVVVVDADEGPALAAAWRRSTARIRGASSLPHHRGWSDQLGFAVALTERDLVPAALPDGWNHPTHLRRLDPASLPSLAHYHSPATLREEPVLRAAVRARAATSSAFARSVECSEGWADVVRSPVVRDGVEPARPELLITGISRSGTSYLASLADRHDRCVVINEPDDVHEPLADQVPWGLGTYLRRLRADIVDGREVANKVVDGRVTEDTAVDQEVRLTVPRVADGAFVLGVKNTLAFLHHLDRIRVVLPDARVAICVRDPADTLASWKRSFSHLRDVDLSVRPHGHPDDRWLPMPLRERLADIQRIEEPAWRRAHHWAFLAELVHDQMRRPNTVLVHYDRLVTDPQGALRLVFGDWDPGSPDGAVQPSRVRGRRSALDDADRQAIRAVCVPLARTLGLRPGG